MSTHIFETISSLSELSPTGLSDLLAFLVDHEQAPGGPYAVDETVAKNVQANFHIYSLFHKAGKELPGALEYIKSSEELLTDPMRQTLFEYLNPIKESQSDTQNVAKYSALIQKQLAPELYAEVEPTLAKITRVDASGEITQLIALFAASFPNKESAPKMPNFEQLGYANLYTWVAYTLYDALLDDVSAPLTLPAANSMHRLAVMSYIKQGVPSSLVHKEFSKVDTSNTLELLYCRFPVTDKLIAIQQIPHKKLLISLLSGRSSIHYLGLIAFYKRFIDKDTSTKRITQLLNLYLAARQLSDDIHDWEEDFLAGRITYPVAHLLQIEKLPKGNHRIQPLLNNLKKSFWATEMNILLKYCLELAEDAKDGFINDLGMVPDSPFITVTVQPIITACEDALKQHAFSKAFLTIQRDRKRATTDA
jgi:hypothetical protein